MTEKKINVWAFVKTNMGSILLTVYIVGSFVFILSSIYKNVLVSYANNAYMQAQQQTIVSIAQELQKAGCQPLSLPLQQGSFDIVDAKCLQPAAPQIELPKK